VKFGFEMNRMNQQLLAQRFLPMLIGWCVVGLIYGTTRFIPGEKWIIPETWLDQQIPFDTQAVWLYLSFFLVVPFAFWRSPMPRVRVMMWAIILSAIISGVFFIFLPSSLDYPQASGENLSDKIFHCLLWIDTQQNCFPSLHASITLICLLGLWQKNHIVVNIFYLAVSLAIGYSIIQLRRHLSLDVGAGILLGFATYFVVSLKLLRKN
jgi:membrane-associated phospholipid phosphatase